MDHLKYPVAAASRLNATYRRIPSFGADAQAAGEALCDIIERHAIDLVIPTCEEVLHLAALWKTNRLNAKLFAPDLAILAQVHNKFRFVELCDELGLPTPQTHLLTSADQFAAHALEGKDLVFKPVWSRFGSQVLIRPQPGKLQKIASTLRAPWVAQEYAEGTELCVYAVARAGRIVALSAYRGLVRAGKGAAICFKPEGAELVRPFVERIVEATQWTGRISFDVMHTGDGRRPLWGCHPMGR